MKKVLVELNEKEVKVLKSVLNENEVIAVEYIDRDNYEEYIGKTVKVIGDVDLSNLNLTKLPINFTEVRGNFNCSNNQLTTLVGSPKEVGGSFNCSDNQLTDLVGAPEKVGENFNCSFNNPLKLTKGLPEFIGGELYID